MKRLETYQKEMRNITMSVSITSEYPADIEELEKRKNKYQQLVDAIDKLLSKDFVAHFELKECYSGSDIGISIVGSSYYRYVKVNIKPKYLLPLQHMIYNTEITVTDGITDEKVKQLQEEEWQKKPIEEKLVIIKELMENEIEKINELIDFWEEELYDDDNED